MGEVFDGGCTCRQVRYRVPAVDEYNDRRQHWPRESLERREALLAR